MSREGNREDTPLAASSAATPCPELHDTGFASRHARAAVRLPGDAGLEGPSAMVTATVEPLLVDGIAASLTGTRRRSLLRIHEAHARPLWARLNREKREHPRRPAVARKSRFQTYVPTYLHITKDNTLVILLSHPIHTTVAFNPTEIRLSRPCTGPASVH
jgi:hypothetical protein